MVASPSMTYCTESPARMMAVMRENTMVIFSFSQPLAGTVRHRMIPVATITTSSAAYAVSELASALANLH